MNNIYSITPTIDPEAAEVISRDEAKAHMHITFDDDNALIDALIISGISTVEKYTNTRIRLATLSVLCSLYCELELPCGPVLNFVSASLRNSANTFDVMNSAGDYYVIDPRQAPPSATGSSFFTRFQPGRTGSMWLIYKAGYGDELPADLKLAVLNEIAYRYENRGDSGNKYASEDVGVSQSAKRLAKFHRRAQWV